MEAMSLEPLPVIRRSKVLGHADPRLYAISRPLVEFRNADVGLNNLQIDLDAAELCEPTFGFREEHSSDPPIPTGLQYRDPRNPAPMPIVSCHD